MARKKVSKKVLAALARGRKKLAAMRKGKKSPGRRKNKKRVVRRVPEQLESIVIQGGNMATHKRRKRRKVSRSQGEFFGRKRRRHSRRRSPAFMGSRKRRRNVRRYSGEKTRTLVHMVTDAGLLAAGGIGAVYATKFVPIANPKLKAALPLILGLALASIKLGKKPLMHKLATGMTVVGALSLIKQMAPAVPLLAGEEFMGYFPTGEQQAMLGASFEDAQIQGELDQLTNEGFVSPANL